MTKAHLEKLFALTRGATVLGALGGVALGCDRSATGDAPIAPAITATIAPANATAAPTPPADTASSPPVPTHRMPIPNAMPRKLDPAPDAGTTPPKKNLGF